jgi:hypothetical protein
VETQAGSEQVLYLYGVVPNDQPVPRGATGSLETIPLAGLTALVESVSASEFAPRVLEKKLQCIDWVSELARKHSSILEEAMRHGPVVPAPLCTLFSSAEVLRASLEVSEQEFQAKLERLKGRQEWGCKVFCDSGKLRATLGGNDSHLVALEAAVATASPGQAYVLRKKRDAYLAELASERMDAATGEMLDSLSLLSVDTRLRPLLSEAASGRSEAMALNVALLIAVSRYPELHAQVEELSARFSTEGFVIELTGPWPAYSFCDDDDLGTLGDDEASPEEVC